MTDNGRYRPSGQEMDDSRANNIAYQYLCHLEEAKTWMERILKRSLPPAGELEENLRNGVVLARLGHFVAPDVVPLGSIYDPDQKRYERLGLNFRHTDNVNLWLRALQSSGFPRIFLPEVPDVFDKKNMPKVVYCLHALSAHLFRLGLTPAMQDLYGKIQFTDDAIMSVCKELKESGVVMPAFQKIGGLFGKDDGKSLEAAIFAIDSALSKGDVQDLFRTLSDPVLQLENIKMQNIGNYLRVLCRAKNEKAETSLNKSLNGSYESDAGDEVLSLPEIQGHIRAVNLQIFWTSLIEAQDQNQKMKILSENVEQLGENFQPENSKFYLQVIDSLPLEQIVTIPMDDVRQLITQIIRTGNSRSAEEKSEAQLINRIRRILSEGSADDLLAELKQSRWAVGLDDFAAPLYFYELQQHISSNELTHMDIDHSIEVLNLVAAVSSASDTGNCDLLYDALSALNENVKGMLDIRTENRVHYLRCVETARAEKLGTDLELLTVAEIMDCVWDANEFGDSQSNKVFALRNLIEAVKDNDRHRMASWLKILIHDLDPCKTGFYMAVLQAKRKELWLDDVVNIMEEAAELEAAVEERKLYLSNVRQAVELRDEQLLRQLVGVDCDLEVWKVLWELFNQYDGHIAQETVNDIVVYFDTSNGTIHFECNEDWKNSDFGVRSQDIETALSKLRKSHLVAEQARAAVKIQSAFRGFLVRRMVQTWVAAAVVIQKWWRIKRQFLHKADGERFMDYYLNNIDLIKGIQGCLMNRQKRKAESDISPQPQYKNMNQDVSSGASVDAVEELIQKLRRQVVEAIKKNQELAKKVEDMDTKIGLLVRNRISIAAIMAENKNQMAVKSSSGIKSLCKEAKTLLDGYQKLFYLLQTRPEYLSRLITQASNPTIQSSIMNLFNMGSSTRDAYLLLRLFSTALREEVWEKLRKPSDTASVYPFVLKMAVGYARQTGGQHGLQSLLAPLIYRVLEENVTLDTNPIDIYRRWLNETEVNSGCASELPRNVTQDEALNHPEVFDRLQKNIHRLKIWVKEFLARLSENTHRFPYALRFIAKSLSEALAEKFPDASEKEILKVIGHLIYYRYVNSALVAPDAFHIISLPAQQPLRADQRKNLASIAKMLQFSASKSGFGEESRHLMQLNPFIIECHEAMKEICRECCRVEDLDNHYHVSQYSEAVLLRRPRVYMTVAELCECHQMLVKLRHTVAPDPTDPIHEVLEDLKEVPTAATLLGCAPEIAANILAEKSLICLELDHEFFAEPRDEKQSVTKTEQSLRREAQKKELRDLKITLARLQEKTKHFEEQIGYYEKYLETCLSNFTLRKKKKKSKSGRVVKYSAEQLKKKGVLTNLDSVPVEQQHNIEFEIAARETNGRFCVKCRFMGVEVDTADIDIQDLLSLQYEGCGVMSIFGKAEVNVNLLIFLLNKKFK